jgi:hypothetical protein
VRRTAAMKAYIAAYLVVLAGLVAILLNALGVLPIMEIEGGGDPSAFVIPLIVTGVLMLGVIAAAAWWSSAPRRPWFWLLGAIPGVLFFLPDIPIIIRAVTAPRSLFDVAFAVAMTAGVLVLLVSAIIAFRDARLAKGSLAA